MKQGVNKLDHNAAAIKRWRSRLKRAMTAIDKLEKQRKRLEAKPQVPLELPGAARVAPEKLVPHRPAAHPVEVSTSDVADDLAIPSFLQRKKLDPVAAEIVAEQAAIKKQKAQGRIAKMKAKQSGETKKMPLTGKAALEAIRNG
jgi:hypothetical protein